ncbi:MAG: peptidylprolyl isomerase [Verrucomicrobia bacterium]|nr:peptidylprolyl isomerase [Verrucomicrobiota bacterium]
MLLLFWALPGIEATVPTDPGLYATFTITHGGDPFGEFTCKLEYQKAPMTVANFVSLAKGTLGWVDPVGRTVKKGVPFYDGIAFHRIDRTFVIQGGSPNGEGIGGPGYTFPDEFHPDLFHGARGVLSMVNSGPNSNGSQFFITIEDSPFLDGKHAVFGAVLPEDIDVITSIVTDVPLDFPESTYAKPIKDLVTEKVVITAIGAEAQAFSEANYGLPILDHIQTTMAREGESFSLQFPQERFHEYESSRSEDLEEWISISSIMNMELPTENAFIDLSSLISGKDKQFFNAYQINHGYVPDGVVGKQITLNFRSSGELMKLNITAERTPENNGSSLGTFTLNGSMSASIEDYIWIQENDFGSILLVLEGFVQLNVDLKFHNETSGSWTGYWFDTSIDAPVDFFGDFSISD